MLNSLRTILNFNVKTLQDNYNLWGASARTCIALTDPLQVKDYQQSVASAADKFTQNSQFKTPDVVFVSHRLFTVRPGETRQEITATFATNNILGLVSRAYAEQEYAVRQSFYSAVSGHTWFGASAGHIFETHVLLWFRHAQADLHLPCTPTVDPSPHLEIPVCGKNMEFFSKIEDLKNVDKHESRKCLVPVAQNFPTLDFIVLTDEFVITVQVTVASTHDAKSIGFKKVYGHLPAELLATRERCHVFLTDSAAKADLLRGQELPDLPKRIRVYSAFFNMGQWESIITSERVKELDEDMVRYYLALCDLLLTFIVKCAGTS
jgi:hypothetical protein